MIDADNLGNGGRNRRGADFSGELTRFDPAADEQQGHVRVVVPGAAVGRSFGSGDRIGCEDEEHVATALVMKRPLHLLEELSIAGLEQLGEPGPDRSSAALARFG